MKTSPTFALLSLSSLLVLTPAQAHPFHESNKASSLTPALTPIADATTTTGLILPQGAPESFSILVHTSDGPLDLQLQKNQVTGANTRLLLDDGSGSLKLVDHQLDRSYLGKVKNHADYTVSAVLGDNGLTAHILRPGQPSLSITPLGSGPLHQVTRSSSGDHDSPPVTPPETSSTTEAALAPITTTFLALNSVSSMVKASTATLPPTKVMDVLEYEIGCEIGSRAFLAKTYGGSLEKASASAQSLVNNLDRRYLHAAGVKHRLGTVIIRQDAKTDPLRDKVRRGDVTGLNAFRDYWNANPKEVGKTHDIAVYHAHWAPSGIAYVNTIGRRNRYAISCGRGATSWADGTIVHEFGHSWNLHHNNKSGFFYEARPRNGRGADKAGGRNHHISIMHGGGDHNIGRLSTEEAQMVHRIRERNRDKGELVKTPGKIRPYGQYDRATIRDGKPLRIDVIANDYDCNNDVLDAALLDTVSFQGGTITLSKATGPGGRNELTYTPPAGFTGQDFFHYTVFDSTGQRDWGAVYITMSGPTKVDLTQTSYNYDFGPEGSPVEKGWTAITPKTTGDIRWGFKGENQPNSRDRGATSGVNNINRDFVFSQHPATLRHKIANGTWSIILNMGDRNYPHEKMTVSVNDQPLGTISSEAKKFSYLTGEVTVTNGELVLNFSQQAGDSAAWVINRMSLKRSK